jgi:hypothetical protein
MDITLAIRVLNCQGKNVMQLANIEPFNANGAQHQFPLLANFVDQGQAQFTFRNYIFS